MRIVRLVVEHQPIALALLETPRFRLLVVLLAIDGPPVEASCAAVDFVEDQRNRLVRVGGLAGFSEQGVIPEGFRRLDPLGLPTLAGVLDHDPHAVLAIVIVRRPQNPHSRILHFDHGIDTFRSAEF